MVDVRNNTKIFIYRTRLRITGSRVRIPLEARFFPNLNSVSLHRAFHVHPWRDVKPYRIHPFTVMIPNFRTDAVYTVCHSVYIFWMHYSMVRLLCSNFRLMTTTNFSGVRLFRNFMYSIVCAQQCNYMGPVERICVFEHFVMLNFNCACPAIQRGQGSGFLSEGSS